MFQMLIHPSSGACNYLLRCCVGCNDTQTKASDRTQNKTHFTTRQKKQEMGDFHIHFPTNTQDHELVQKHNIRITYKCHNTIANWIKPPRDHTPPHNQWGIYQLTCNTCNLSYVGQTNRSLRIRYKEHIRYIRSNNSQSAYAPNILQNRYEYGPMDNTMTLLKHINNQSLLLPYEQYHIQALHHNRKLIPKQSPGDTNSMFQAVINP